MIFVKHKPEHTISLLISLHGSSLPGVKATVFTESERRCLVECPSPTRPPLLSLTFLQLIVPAGPHWCHTCFCHAARTLALGPEHSSPDTCWDDPFTSVRSLTKSHFLYQALLDCPAQLNKLSLLPTLLGHFLSLSAHFIYAPPPYFFCHIHVIF